MREALDKAHREWRRAPGLEAGEHHADVGGVAKLLGFRTRKTGGAAGAIAGHSNRGRRQEASRPGDSKEGTIVGTFQYMSPEQVEREGVGWAKRHLFSLGAVLYEMLTGKEGIWRKEPAERGELDFRERAGSDSHGKAANAACAGTRNRTVPREESGRAMANGEGFGTGTTMGVGKRRAGTAGRRRWRESLEREVGVDGCGRVGLALDRGGNFLAAHRMQRFTEAFITRHCR